MCKAKILFDTDIGGDCDDAGALAMLHRLCDLGEAELVAVTACYASPFVAGCIDAINTYYSRRVPVGICYEKKTDSPGVYAEALCREFPNAYPPEAYKRGEGAPDTVSLLRKTLSEAEDGSLTFVATGSFTSAAALVTSEPDEISPLSGKELIAKKICRTVMMGGRFFESWPMPVLLSDGFEVTWEWNIKGDVPAAATVFSQWPGELVLSSYEIGLWVVTMREYAKKAPAENPARRAYELHPCGRNGRESWDHTAMLEAVRPDRYWYRHPMGRISVDEEGITRWHEEEGGQQTYLLPKVNYDTVCEVIDDLVLPQDPEN